MKELKEILDEEQKLETQIDDRDRLLIFSQIINLYRVTDVAAGPFDPTAAQDAPVLPSFMPNLNLMVRRASNVEVNVSPVVKESKEIRQRYMKFAKIQDANKPTEICKIIKKMSDMRVRRLTQVDLELFASS